MSTKTIIEGTVKPDGTLEVAQKLELPPGKVRITVETLSDVATVQPGLLELFQQIQQRTAESGTGRTKKEIDTDVEILRNEWEERMAEIERLQDEAQQKRE